VDPSAEDDPRANRRSHLRAAADPARQPLDAALWVAIRYDLGQGEVRTLDIAGRPLGDALSEPDFEYNLYRTACDRHAGYVASGGTRPSSPSGWYELLRFGRRIGPDPLPDDAAHWRQIRTPKGTVWADLNAEGTFKFSEADFLPVMGWNCFGDDTNPLDQRCDSIELKRVIRDPDPHNPQRMERDHITARLGRPDVQARLRRAICKFPTEWDRTTIETRFQWIRDPKERLGMDDEIAWKRFLRHAEAMSFDDLPDTYKKATWRFHPQEFIEVMRRCGWLSKLEITQAIPSSKGNNLVSLSTVLEQHLINSRGQTMRPRMLYPAISHAMRKYGIENVARTSHWFAQVLQETGDLNSMREFGDSTYLTNYYEGRCRAPVQRLIKGTMKTLSPLGNCAPGDGVRFSGKGLIQLTGGDNYRSYQAYRGQEDFTTESNSEKLISDAHHACEAGGVYWASKQRYTITNKVLKPFGKLGMNYWADKNAFKRLPNTPDLETTMKEMTKGINSGLEHLEERTVKFKHVFIYLSDLVV
jgi:predicted chitinase